jgi:hypothetical protein
MANGVPDDFWACAELRHADLGDARRVQRLIRIVAAASQNPEESIPGLFANNRDAAKAAYRFFDNDQVEAQSILHAHRRATLDRIRAADLDLVLLVEDTTQFDFTRHHATAGLGSTGAPGLSGFFLHNTLALEPAAGVPLGILDAHCWVRDDPPGVPRPSARAIEEKESGRWLDALRRSTEALPPHLRTLTIADREADIFEFFAFARDLGRQVLVRAHHDRNVLMDGEVRGLWEAARAAEPLGVVAFTVSRQANRPERRATAVLHAARVDVQPPQRLAARHLAPVSICAILLQEIGAPDGQEPISWLLLTSLSVDTLEQADQCVLWYTYRWAIERFHFTLKSGCNYEKLQLQTADRLWRALAVYMIVAWRLLYVDLVARTHPDAPCTTIFQDDEWKALYCHRHKVPVPPPTPPDVRTAVRWVAMLGGFLGRKRDGEPGVKTLWRGLRRLQDLVEMWRIMRPSP